MHHGGGGPTCEDYRSIDIAGFARKNLLRPGVTGIWQWHSEGQVTAYINFEVVDNGCMTLDYRIRPYGGEWEDVSQTVLLCYTPMHYGGERPWFMCPNCDRRCRKLYGGSQFYCRKCHGLSYQSQRARPEDHLLDRAQALRLRLGGSANMMEQFPARPRGMHRRTYERLRAEGQAIESALYGAMAERLGIEGF